MTKKVEGIKKKPGSKKKVRPETLGVAQAIDDAMMGVKPALPEGNRNYLRMLGMMHYSTDLGRCSVHDMLRHPLFSTLPEYTLEQWAKLDKWREKRQQTLQKWSDHLVSTIGSQLVQKRLEEIKTLQSVKTKVLERLVITHEFVRLVSEEEKAVEIAFKSDVAKWEKEHAAIQVGALKLKGRERDCPTSPKKTGGVCKHCGRAEIGHNDPFWGVRGDALVASYAKLVELEFEIAERVMGVLGIQAGGQNAGPTGLGHENTETLITETITKDEALAAAHAVIRQRRLALGPAPTDVSPKQEG